MIIRALETILHNKLHKQKEILLFGARQVGKSTLLQKLTSGRNDFVWLNADDPAVQLLLTNPTLAGLKRLFGKNKIIIIDEAQQLAGIGKTLKLITDQLKDLQVIATGSSAFDLKNSTNEPLTGRKWEYHLYPLSFSEMVLHTSLAEEISQLPHRMVFGSYPEIITHPAEEKERLKLLTESYLYKDLLMWNNIKKPEKIIHLLRALALQIGSEVSYNELSNMLGMDKETVEKYIILLEQTYVIFRLPAYSTNQRKELKKSRKIYFFDTGIRNALIGDYRPAEQRQDAGALWENYIIAEMYKKDQYAGGFGKFYFWRTADQQEIDLIIDMEGRLNAYEIKWNNNAKVRLSKTFSSSYPNHSFAVITPGKTGEFLL